MHDHRQSRGTRWRMLAIIGLGFTVLTLNWFDVATAFPLIGAEFNAGLGSPHRGQAARAG